MALPDPVADAELLMMAASMPRTVTDARTIAPPAKAQRPGLSPNTRRTQRGFRIGSMAVMSTASRAVTCLMAVAYRIYGLSLIHIYPVIMLTTPMFLPAAMKLGISPIFYGTIINIALAIGIVTPPVGCVLFVACAVGKTTIQEVIGEFIPFYLVMIVVLLLLVFFPQLVLYLPMKFMPGAV